jgi:TonB family protein
VGEKSVSFNLWSSYIFQLVVLIFVPIFSVSAVAYAQAVPSPGQPAPSPAQSTPTPVQSAPTTGQPTRSDAQSVPNASANADAVQKRIERARALAAAHQLQTAASELEAIRKGAQEDSVRNVTSVMLMGIYLEEGTYARAESLLEEAFQSRGTQGETSIRSYFALAGQAINGARAHLARYRGFGINVTDSGLPTEALTDLDRLRSLLERMVAQAKEVSGDRRAYDSLALLEDVLGIRLSLARDSEDRAKWESEYAGAREVLASSQTQIASRGGLPSLPPSTVKPSLPSRESDPPSTTSSRENSATETKPTARIADPPPDKQSVSSKENGASPKASTPVPARPTDSPDPQNPDGPKTISTGLLNARATKRVLPTYPQSAKSAGAEGLVRVYVTVGENGTVIDVSRSEGPALLREAAEQAALQWRFHPTEVSGKAVRLNGYIEFTFTP